tara:strand:+ start:1640 stop:1954 length:315 start_codon:yes stop_codon:yes gene_type:complete
MSALVYWQSPDYEVKLPFIRVNPNDDILESLSGILIISNVSNQCLFVQIVSNLSRELHEIMRPFKEEVIVYYHAGSSSEEVEGSDAEYLRENLEKITATPVFYG